MPSATIRVSYEIVTPESAEFGDIAERGWEDEEGTEHSFRVAVELLRGTEPSSSVFHLGVWYTAYDHDGNFRTGEHTNRSYHLRDASPQFQRRLYQAVTARP